MKKKYNSTELAQIVRTVINTKYTDENIFFKEFKTTLKKKVVGIEKITNNKDLTENEIETRAKGAAQTFVKKVENIPTDYIQAKLSEEFIYDSVNNGITLDDKRLYDAAKNRVKEMIDFQYKTTTTEIRAINKKRK